MRMRSAAVLAAAALSMCVSAAPVSAQAAKKPNILFIMGDDIGWMQVGLYQRGLGLAETPNIDRIGREGAMFTSYYAEQSCTAGRNAFFTGMTPLRTGMIPPQLPGSPSFLQPGTPALAKFLYDLGYTTGEFGKNHLGDHTDALPTAHGFQEFWGYLYHLDAMEQVSFPDINSSPTKQGIAPPCKNTPIPGLAEVPGAVDPKTMICLTPPRPVLWCKSSDGTEASDGDCSSPQVSGDGLFVAFVCSASNLPKSGTGAASNTIYIHDRAGGSTFIPMYDWPKTSQAFSGAANPAWLRRYMSSDVSRISFESSGAINSVLVYLNQSSQNSTLTQMCQPFACVGPAISSDGNRIAFTTASAALDGGDVNAHADVYVYDVNADTYSLVSLNSDKSQGNNDVADGDIALSGDGALIAFSSGLADNFAGSNTANALLLRNIDAGTLTAVSVNDGGGAVLPVLMPRPALSDEGIVLAFTSNNTALAPHPNKPPADALVRNMKADLLRSMCRSRSGAFGNNTCFSATVSADGLWGAFAATADNLVPDDTNSQQDIFVVSLDALFDDIFADGNEP